MVLWNFIETQIFPLFGTLPTDVINMGWLGEWSVVQILQIVFWLTVGCAVIHFLCWLPYQLILSAMQVRKWRKRK